MYHTYKAKPAGYQPNGSKRHRDMPEYKEEARKLRKRELKKVLRAIARAGLWDILSGPYRWSDGKILYGQAGFRMPELHELQNPARVRERVMEQRRQAAEREQRAAADRLIAAERQAEEARQAAEAGRQAAEGRQRGSSSIFGWTTVFSTREHL